jgi:hypothetical protein
MISCRRASVALVALVCAIQGLGGQAANAKEAPVKEIPAISLGWEVEPVTKGKTCSLSQSNECAFGVASGEPGGFKLPAGVAGGPASKNDIYVAETNNHRVQELTADGQFVRMWGRKVNKNGSDACAQVEEKECQAGEENIEAIAGEVSEPNSIAVDPTSGDVYVAETLTHVTGGQLLRSDRVQEFSGEGKFILEIGRGVNETTKGNLCTQVEVENNTVKCTSPIAHLAETPPPAESGSFGDIHAMAAGGPEGRLYVTESNGVQEFDFNGTPVPEPAKTINHLLAEDTGGAPVEAAALAVDSAGAIYMVEFQDLIRKFDSTGTESSFTAAARNSGDLVSISEIAIDEDDRMAIVEREGSEKRGTIYEVVINKLHQATTFPVMGNILGVGFNGGERSKSGDRLYIAISSPGQEVLMYEPLPAGELVAEPSGGSCTEGLSSGSDVTFDCKLEGEVDPWGVSGTEVWFEWGRTASLGTETAHQKVSVLGPEGHEEPPTQVSAAISGLLPNPTAEYFFRLDGNDLWVQGKELLTSVIESFKTPAAHPRVVGQPEDLFKGPTSAVIFTKVNPENVPTEYEFGYAPVESCKEELVKCTYEETEHRSSSTYGPVGVTLEAKSLQPSTEYRYRLFAVNAAGEAFDENGGSNVPEGTFSTETAPLPEAMTGPATGIGAEEATISGIVNPNGRPGAYQFELGVYNGTTTQFSVVSSGSVLAKTPPAGATATLVDLQPGVTYGYRLRLQNDFGQSVGQTLTFTTAKEPELMPPPSVQFLVVGTPGFPEGTSRLRCKKGYRLNARNKCIKSKVRKKTTRPKRKNRRRRKG